MTAKHTQGPWRIGTPGPNGCYTVGTEGGLMVAMVAHSANHLAECEQAIGDARLISAAPELLEALQELLSAVFEPAGCTSEIVNDKQAFKGFLAQCEAKTKSAEEKARAAIAKATGESA